VPLCPLKMSIDGLMDNCDKYTHSEILAIKKEILLLVTTWMGPRGYYAK